MIDEAAEHERIREVESQLDDSDAAWRVRPADDGDGVQIILAIRETKTRRVASLSSCQGKTETADLIRGLAQCAGLPEPWAGQPVR